MELDGETLREIVVSVVAVSLFIAATVYIGTSYGGSNLGPTGGLALVASIALFVVLMAIVGVFLSR
ncbi:MULTISPECIES: DUF7472 family protein [Haloprofundus]|uniref:DUF7472 family protein n=1 Tax=Haloprofundus TaxID=1911573 RepID=UPI000E449217|nr:MULTISPECIES: hypothetical protein [Haloprofundus]QCJ46962.1 hypothetical protein FCF25_07500 [Haloprofundus sp. MHR1]